jgi:hypothetical protein
VGVRGQVVKTIDGVLGRSWIHLRDGSGSDLLRTNDLTITTQESAKLGDLLLVEGMLRIDRDVGAGYVYPVLLEDAEIKER